MVSIQEENIIPVPNIVAFRIDERLMQDGTALD